MTKSGHGKDKTYMNVGIISRLGFIEDEMLEKAV